MAPDTAPLRGFPFQLAVRVTLIVNRAREVLTTSRLKYEHDDRQLDPRAKENGVEFLREMVKEWVRLADNEGSEKVVEQQSKVKTTRGWFGRWIGRGTKVDIIKGSMDDVWAKLRAEWQPRSRYAVYEEDEAEQAEILERFNVEDYWQ